MVQVIQYDGKRKPDTNNGEDFQTRDYWTDYIFILTDLEEEWHSYHVPNQDLYSQRTPYHYGNRDVLVCEVR